MAILDIYTYPEPVLLHKAAPVEKFDDGLRRLLSNMAETMYAAIGVGLAAPQVGVAVRAIVVDASPKLEDEKLLKLVNPVITFAEGTATCEEGCLSVPGYSEIVARAAHIIVEAYDEYGKPVKIASDTFLATVLQHEIDHLNGVLFIDHVGRLKRDFIKRKLRKKARKNDGSTDKWPL